MTLGPSLSRALRDIAAGGDYTGIGYRPTFRGRHRAIPWRIMAGLEDRSLVRVLWHERMRGTGEPVWRAEITENGRAVLAAHAKAEGAV